MSNKRILSAALLIILATQGFFAFGFSVKRGFPGSLFTTAVHAATEDDSDEDDAEMYEKYSKYLGYDRRKKYRKYQEYKGKYKFDSSAEKAAAKDHYEKYKQFKKNPALYPQYARYYDDYKKYKKYKNYYQPYKEYSKYKNYNTDEYDNDSYKNYNTAEYKAGYERYKSYLSNQANLGGDSLGPEITVGLHEYTRNELRDDSFRVRAYSAANDQDLGYLIKNEDGETLLTVAAGNQARIKYDADQRFRIYNYDNAVENEEIFVSEVIKFVAASEADEENIVFDTNLPISGYEDYRGEIWVSYYDASGADADRIWVINNLQLEHYVWGMGEITGTGDMDYNRVMTIAYRTYGYWKIKFSTRYAAQGFKVDATSGNQIYYGYNYENSHARIKEAAVDTRGKIVMYGDRIAITPYSSWTDGRTRSWEEKWGSDNYPWCQSVDDPYGEHPSKSAETLFAEGNHMVGLSAHGALDRADAGWSYSEIIDYYFDDVRLHGAY